MTSTVPTSAPAARRPGDNGKWADLRLWAGGHGRDAFDQVAIVIDPQVPDVVRDELRARPVAGRLAAADAARRDEDLLKRLIEVEPKIRDLVASTDESSTEIDMAEGLKFDVDALVEMTNQAINDLSVRGEEADRPALPSPSRP